MRLFFLLLLLQTALFAQLQPPKTVSVTEETFHGRRAWVLSNGLIRVTLLAGGGHIAEIRLLSDDPKKNVNPMRVPHYQTIEPHRYNADRDDSIFGKTPHRWLSSGYMGHLLCFPIYGSPSAAEAQAGLGNHGEAPIVEWHEEKAVTDSNGITFRYAADLPKTQFHVERAVRLNQQQRFIHVEEWVQNLAPYDRPINWMEHATFGPPFIEPGKTILDASATSGLVANGAGSLQPNSTVTWPQGKATDGQSVNLRAFQSKPHSGTYYALRLDPSRTEQFFTIYHPDYRVLIGYLFPAKDNWWLADWQENRRIAELPWNGQVVARGLEFGTSPFAEGLQKSVERGSLLNTPTYQWIGAHQKLKKEFTIVLFEIPEHFQGVKDLRTERGIPVLQP